MAECNGEVVSFSQSETLHGEESTLDLGGVVEGEHHLVLKVRRHPAQHQRKMSYTGCPLKLVKQIPWFFPDSFPIFQDISPFSRIYIYILENGETISIYIAENSLIFRWHVFVKFPDFSLISPIFSKFPDFSLQGIFFTKFPVLHDFSL